MNTLELMMDLENLHKMWSSQASDPRSEKPEWVRGVVYGIMLTIKMVHYYYSRKEAA